MTQIEPHTTGSLRVQRLPRWYTGVSEMIIVAGVLLLTVGIVVGSLSAFILIMPLLGWLLASTLLFWVISWAFGSTRPVFDVGVAALMAALIQLAFSAGLGLSLPPGILEGVFSWIN